MKKTLLSFIFITLSFQSFASDVYFKMPITSSSIDALKRNIFRQIDSFSENDQRIITIHLASEGGNIPEAINFVRYIRRISAEYSVQIDTKVGYEKCQSACTILFTAGNRRIARKKSSFGFHAPSIQITDVPKGKSKEEVIEWARELWLDSIADVDSQLPYLIKERKLLHKSKMIFLRGNDLATGYVNTFED